MVKSKVIVILAIGFSCLLLLLGRSSFDFLKKSPAEIKPEINPAESLFAEADLDYEVPVAVPNILVNQLGFLPGSEKMAVFRGADIPERFRVIDEKTGAVVWEGEIEERDYDTYTGEYNSYGDFTELMSPGNYYVEAELIGRSYSFAVRNGLYDDTFRAACKQFYYNRCGITLTEEYAGSHARGTCHTGMVPLREDSSVSLDVSGGWHQSEDGSKDIVEAAQAVNTLLLTYELNGAAFSDHSRIPESGNQIPDILDELRYETDWLLKMQDPQSGGVYAGITVEAASSAASASTCVEPVSAQATAMYCAAMAKFSYSYQAYDAAYAGECLKAAGRAWRYLERNPDERIAAEYFLAAAEMYRAAGYQAYHTAVTRYLTGNQYWEQLNQFDETVWMGCITYLSAKVRVNRGLCDDIMKVIMQKAEVISAGSRRSRYLTAGNQEQDNNDELLENMFCLSFVNHVIKNHEYGTVIENHLHYFMGRNSQGLSYVDEVGAKVERKTFSTIEFKSAEADKGYKNYKDVDLRLGIMNRMVPDSKLIFMLAEIKSNELVSD